MIFFKKHKKVFISIFSLILAVYAVFLFILPNIINLNNYKKDIQKIVFESAKLNLDFEDIKIITSPDLKAGVKIEGLHLSYPDSRKIASILDTEVKVSLLPLIFKTVQVSDVVLKQPELYLVYTKDFQIDIAKYIMQNLEKQHETPDTAAAELPVRISEKLPVVDVKDYKLVLKDERTLNSLTLDGESFVLDKAVLNKHFRIASNGKFLINNNENIKYNIRVFSFFPPSLQTNTDKEKGGLSQIDFIKEIVKYSPKGDIIADLNFKEHAGHVDITGSADADKVSVIINGKRLPDSFFHLKSSGHKSEIDSNFYISKNEKAVFQADIMHGHKTKIDMNVKTDKISFSSVQEFLSALLNSLNIENETALFSTNGFIQADFTLKTNMKKFESSGFFKICDGSISHKKIPVSIKNIIADIDFSNNNTDIKQAGALVNGTPVNAEGKIDSKANADIKIETGKIDIAPLFNAFAPIDLKKTYVLKNGILALDVVIKGQLKDIEPNLNASLSNLLLLDKKNTFRLHAPSIKVKITPNDITLVPFSVLMNSSKIDVSGSIKDFMKKMKIDIIVKGSINAKDLKNLLPKDVRYFAQAKGVIPVFASIKGNEKKIDVTAQAQSSNSNYFAPVTVKKMTGKPGLINLSLSYADDSLSLSDASLYLSNKTAFSQDFSYNKKGAVKIAGLSGSVFDVSSSRPSLKLNFSIPQTVLLSSAAMPSAFLQVKGDMDIYGGMTSPMFKGFFSVKDVNLPDMLTKVQDVDLEFNGETISVKVQNLDINGTAMNVDAEASSKFSNVFLIKTMKVSSANFDADNLFKAMDKMAKTMPAQASSGSGGSSQGLVLPAKISDGSIDIQRFKMKQAGGSFSASNISGAFTLINDIFKMNNLKAEVYGGNVSGAVTYSLATTASTAKINGKGINANSVVTVFAALKDQIMGNVDFDADVRLKGASYEQQMKSLNGKVKFALKNGQMGSLGRFETFLKADNLLSQGFVATKIGSLVNTVAPYNTGKFEYLNGDIKIVNGTAHLNPVKMSGPHMSLLITGNVNILSMISTMQIMGSLSPEVASALGPVADLSVEKFAVYIPKFGASIAAALSSYNQAANKAELAKIPALTPDKKGTKSFKVILNGNLNNPPSAVKRFQWLNTPEKIQEKQQSLQEAVKPAIPASKEELKQQVKEGLQNQLQNQLENNEKVQELKQNKAVQTFSSIYKFYKDNSKSNGTNSADGAVPQENGN